MQKSGEYFLASTLENDGPNIELDEKEIMDRRPSALVASEPDTDETGAAAETNLGETLSTVSDGDPEKIEFGLQLDRARIRELQGRLLVSGHDPNGVDGVIGKGTRAAITTWQRGNGFFESGYFTRAQIDVLRQMTVGQYDTWLETKRAEENRRASNRQTRRNSGGWYRDSKGMYCRKVGNSGHYCPLWKPRALR